MDQRTPTGMYGFLCLRLYDGLKDFLSTFYLMNYLGMILCLILVHLACEYSNKSCSVKLKIQKGQKSSTFI